MTVIASVVLAAALGGAVMFAWLASNLPNPNQLQDRTIPQTTKIYDRTGEKILYEMHGDQKRTLVTLDAVSPYVKGATLSAEDRTFYQHHGFRPLAILRAVFLNVFYGKTTGGSTITQQLVKNAILSSEKTYTRKLKELVLSLEIERRYSKDDILKMYLNEIPYDALAYGVESAAQTFFAKSAKDLTADEAALLAVLPRSTTYYSPYGNHRDGLMKRQQAVLDTMAEDGYLTADEAEAAKKVDTLAKVVQRRSGIIAPHFIFYVREQLVERFGEQAVEVGGLKVVTTLDFGKQEAAEQAVADNLQEIRDGGGNSAALLAVDPKKGDILAMVGSADYSDDSINGKFNALTGRLQPGSSIKPFVYAAGFERGYTPDTVLYDVATEFGTGGTSYAPHDYDLKERGPVTVREALGNSLNIPAVKMLYLVGVSDFLDYATGQLGYTIPDRKWLGLSVTLGGVAVNPVEHISAFGAFANEGELADTRAVLRVEDASGKTLYKADETPKRRRVMSEQVARLVTGILSDDDARAATFGHGGPLTLPDRPVAAKTGTTNDYKDAWTVGYTPSLVAGVWVGDQVEGRSMNRVGGSRVAAPIWNEFMRLALAGTPVEAFIPPEPAVTGKPVLDGDKSGRFLVKIDKYSGKRATENTPPEAVEERAYGAIHDILYFVRREDPRGPMPDRPEDDPQFAGWEKGVTNWAEKQGVKASGDAPPTEFDDLHVPENRPSVSFLYPQEGATFDTRRPVASVSATAPRGVSQVEYLLDGERVGFSDYPPFAATLEIPNHFLKGFHALTAAVYDDVRNRAETSLDVNLTAPPGDLGLSWHDLFEGTRILRSSFPYQIRLSVPDSQSVAWLRLAATREGGETVEIGSLGSPAMPDLTLTWNDAAPGRYALTAQVELTSGDRLTSTVSVEVE
jgi:penicillin-binding protein 1C